MSKEADQALVLLSVLEGVLKTLEQGNSFAKVEIKRTIGRVIELSVHAARYWPGIINRGWASERRLRFMGYIETLPKETYPAVELVLMCERIVIDLSDMYAVGTRGELVANLLPGIKKLKDHVDHAGLHFDAFESSTNILDVLYGILEITDSQFAA